MSDSPTRSYIITNRISPGYNINGYLSKDRLWWYESKNLNDTNYEHYHSKPKDPSTSAPSEYTVNIVAQLKEQTDPNLIVFIHGLSTDWYHAVPDTGTFGANLATQGYTGLVIGFSWPSFGSFWSEVDYASGEYAFPPTADERTIRGNIGGSIGSFQNFLDWLQSMKTEVSNLTTTVVCHSEGNYMAMCGFNGYSNANIDHCLLLAADINSGAFLSSDSSLEGQYKGQGFGISNNAGAVTVYFSSNDYLLADATGGAYKHHNPGFLSRMGLSGPAYAQGTMLDNVYSVDCSPVINLPNLNALMDSGKCPRDVSPHTSYLFFPQILNDINSVATNASQSSIANRSPGPYAGAYIMNIET